MMNIYPSPSTGWYSHHKVTRQPFFSQADLELNHHAPQAMSPNTSDASQHIQEHNIFMCSMASMKTTDLNPLRPRRSGVTAVLRTPSTKAEGGLGDDQVGAAQWEMSSFGVRSLIQIAMGSFLNIWLSRQSFSAKCPGVQ